MPADKVVFGPLGGLLRWIEYPHLAVFGRFPMGNLWGVPDMPIYAGAGTISGTVIRVGTPAARNVYLFDRDTGALVARTTSAGDGTYSIPNLNPDREYIVLATDADDDQYNAATADRMTPAT